MVWIRINKFLDLLVMWLLGYLILEKNLYSKYDSYFFLGCFNVIVDFFEDISFKLFWILVKIVLFFCSMLFILYIFI